MGLHSITRWRPLEIYLVCRFDYKYALGKQASWFLLVNACHVRDHAANNRAIFMLPRRLCSDWYLSVSWPNQCLLVLQLDIGTQVSSSGWRQISPWGPFVPHSTQVLSIIFSWTDVLSQTIKLNPGIILTHVPCIFVIL